jgi:hypothetical protein
MVLDSKLSYFHLIQSNIPWVGFLSKVDNLLIVPELAKVSDNFSLVGLVGLIRDGEVGDFCLAEIAIRIESILNFLIGREKWRFFSIKQCRYIESNTINLDATET